MATAVAQATLRADLNGMLEQADDREAMLIAEQAAPDVSAKAKNGQYPRFNLKEGQLLNNLATTRLPDGSYGEVTREYTSDTYDTIDRGLVERVDDAYANDIARYFSAEVVAARQTKYNVLLAKEVRVGALFLTTGAWGADQDGAVWATSTTDALGDVLTAVDSLNGLGVIPNTIIMGGTAFKSMSLNTSIQNWVRGAMPTDSTLNLTPARIASSFSEQGIERILVGKAVYNTANENQTVATAQCWPTGFVWIGSLKSGDPLGGGAARNFVWNAEGGSLVTESYRDETRRSNMVRVRQHTSEKIIDTNAGVLIEIST